MKFVLEIELGNDAVRNPGDVADVLDIVAANQRECGFEGCFNDCNPIRDINGNTVGKWEVIDETTCKVCGVPAASHGYWSITDPSTHKWEAR